MNPLISVIVPVYKVEQYLDECVLSIIHQTYTNLEIILVDDGSPDRCPEMCDDYAKQDSRIKVVHKKNGGLSSARNMGIEVANGYYISFIDSDDYIDRYMIERLYNAFGLQDKIGIVSCMVYSFDKTKLYAYRPELDIEEVRITSHYDFRRSMVKESVSHIVCNKLYLTSLLKNSPMFRLGIYNEDALFHYYLSDEIEKCEYKMLEIPERLYFYRINPGSITNGRTRVFCLRDMISNVLEIQSKNVSTSINDICERKYKSYLLSLVVELLFHKDLKEKMFRKYYCLLKQSVSFSYARGVWGYRHQLSLLLAKFFPYAFYSKIIYSFCFKCGKDAPF